MYFKPHEFMMGNENVYDKMDSKLLAYLELVRENVGQALTITSSYRSEDYNKSIGGAFRSKHLTGNAVDISCNNSILRAKIVKEALKLGLTCGIAKSFVHLDNRETQIIFTYG